MLRIDNKTITLRQVHKEDCKLLWKWVNDPVVRASAFSSDSISWEEHSQWFLRKLADPNCYIFIALACKNTLIGQVRFDAIGQQQFEIDISIAASQRGSGYGSSLIEIAVQELATQTPTQAIHAFIKPKNYASIRVFEKAKFKALGKRIIKENLALHYERKICP
ncbi:GNAT family N-acetyltransferase [Lusitaniella coriacea]|uniref:GNAT family N-acetyltransferase n=1 Tax=Lusitaniella coriacea TaxID=1983105 RepID=UPI003CED0031